MTEQRTLRLRVGLVYGGLLVFAIAIIVKLFTIQLVEGDKWREQAINVATAVRSVQPDRGYIYSDDGRLLATSVPEYEIHMDMKAEGLTDEVFFKGIDSLALGMSGLFGDRGAAEYKRDLMDARARGERYHLVKRNVDYEQMMTLERFPIYRMGRMKSGLIPVKHYERKQWFGRLARRTIGDVPGDSGVYGTEKSFEKTLHGIAGNQLERRLVGGAWMPVDDGDGQEPVAGSDIHTTIDINLQDLADHSLETQLRKNGAEHGCVVVMETKTGEIKAISNLTLLHDSTYGEVENYAVGHATEPGSTFKTASLMVGLEDGLVTPEQLVDTRGGKRKYRDRWMHDSHEEGYGIITLARALEVSSNTGVSQAIQAAYQNQPQRFVDGLRKLGFGQPLGVRIPGEAMPTLRAPGEKGWSGVSLPWMSIGYEVAVTPLRTLTFYNAIANNGRMMQPLFVTSITRNNKEVEHFQPVVLNEKICSDATLGKIKKMLEGVVDTGTAMNLRSTHFRIAGKTGTAQIATAKEGYKVNGVNYQASFVGYFPAEAPRYTCIIVVNSPSARGYTGNVVAGPIFRDIADKLYGNRLDMQDAKQLAFADSLKTKSTPRTPLTFAGDQRDLLASLQGLGIPSKVTGEGEWASTQAADSAVVITPRNIPGDQLGMVPNVLGMGLKDALYILENRGIKVHIVGNGMVKRQSLSPGSRFSKGSAITLELT